jgi:hypothetical protein
MTVTPEPVSPERVTVKSESVRMLAFGQMGTLIVLYEVPVANVSVPVVLPP